MLSMRHKKAVTTEVKKRYIKVDIIVINGHSKLFFADT